MKILNEQDEEIQESDVDLEAGYLKQDFITIAYHEPVPAVVGKSHSYVTSVLFSDGTTYQTTGEDDKNIDADLNFIPFGDYVGKEIAGVNIGEIIDEPYVPAQEEWYENEEIKRYVLYTEDELKAQKEAKKLAEEEQQRTSEREIEYQTLLEEVKALKTLLEAQGVSLSSQE